MLELEREPMELIAKESGNAALELRRSTELIEMVELDVATGKLGLV